MVKIFNCLGFSDLYIHRRYRDSGPVWAVAAVHTAPPQPLLVHHCTWPSESHIPLASYLPLFVSFIAFYRGPSTRRRRRSISYLLYPLHISYLSGRSHIPLQVCLLTTHRQICISGPSHFVFTLSVYAEHEFVGHGYLHNLLYLSSRSKHFSSSDRSALCQSHLTCAERVLRRTTDG